jgi:hypothetical protein
MSESAYHDPNVLQNTLIELFPADRFNYDFSEVKFERYSHPITIICRDRDDDGTPHGRFNIFINNMRKLSKEGGGLCTRCKNKITRERRKGFLSHTHDTLLSELQRIYPHFDFSKMKYEHPNSLLEFICPNHGKQISKAYSLLVGVGCRRCKSDARQHRIDAKKEKELLVKKQEEKMKHKMRQVIESDEVVPSPTGEFIKEHLASINRRNREVMRDAALRHQIEKYPVRNIIRMLSDAHHPAVCYWQSRNDKWIVQGCESLFDTEIEAKHYISANINKL